MKWNSSLGTSASGQDAFHLQEYLLSEAQEGSGCHPVLPRKHQHQSAESQYLKPLPILYCYSLMDTTSWNQTVLIFFYALWPQTIVSSLTGLQMADSEVWTAGVTGKQRLIDWGPEQYLRNTLGMNSHTGLKPPNITSLRLQMFLCLPLFSPSGKWTGLLSSML